MQCDVCGGAVVNGVCTNCGKGFAPGTANAPAGQENGGKPKKPIHKKWWFWVLIVLGLILVLSVLGGGGEKETKPTGSAEKPSASETAADKTETPDETQAPAATEAPVKKDVYDVGDVILDDDMKIVYVSSGYYTETNQFSQPKAGNRFIKLTFSFENLSKNSEKNVSVYDFECYADGFSAEAHYTDLDLSATLSPGRYTVSSVFFEVPETAEEIEVEYEANFFSDKKIKFAFRGEQDSGYQPSAGGSRTADAVKPGETVKAGDLEITYLESARYESDNMFIQPASGCHYVSCVFVFENLGKQDQNVSSISFACYADGAACSQTMIRDDDLSATLSAGRKTQGTVTFEVPDGAETVEFEYDDSFWTSDPIVFDASGK